MLEAADELVQFPGVEALEPSLAPGRPARFTTRELLQVEREALELALAGFDVDAPCVDRKVLARTLMQSGSELSGQQRMLVHQAASQPDRVVCVVGAAGAGKTTAMRVLADAYRESAVPMLGAAPSGRAADGLASSAGVPGSTLHRLLLDAQREGGLPRRCVLVVDEASMAETRVLAPILELVERAEGKAILVGDPHQLSAVGTGGLYPALCERLGAISLAENRRQRDLSERQALARLRAGDPDPYLAHAARRGRLQLADDPTVAKQRLLEDWWRVGRRDLHGTVMLAYRRADIRDLNEAARTLMLRAGRLGNEAVELGEREFRVGDRVLWRRNDTRLGVRNGMRGTIVDLNDTAVTLRIDTGATRPVPLTYAADHLEYGYALTGHAAQGATVERAFVLLHDSGALQEWGYVACSRARTETRLYLAETGREHETHARRLNTLEAPERAARALARSSAEPLALGQTSAAARLLSHQQRELDQQRRHAKERLVEAQQGLERLRWRGRRRHAVERRAEIDLYQTALRLADEKVIELMLQPDRTLRPAAPTRRLRTPRQPRLEREPPGLGLER